MKRVIVNRVGEARDSLEVQEIEDLEAGPGQVLVQMKAIPINPADLLVMRGRHIFTPTYPCGTGIEGVGRVIAHGEGVNAPPLDALVALPFGETWAEQVVLPAESAIPLPEGIDIFQGSMLALNPVTALGLVMGMKRGEWLIHNAANSSLGRLITRVAAHKGINNISVVRRRGLEDELIANGADHVLIDGDDLSQRVKAFTGTSGVDRALDAVSGNASGRLFDCVAEGGELVCYGLLAGDQVVIPSAQLIFRDVLVRGYSRLRSLKALSTEGAQLLYADLFEGAASGLFYTPVLKTFTFDELYDAVELAERSGGEGKVLLIPPSD